MSAGRSARRMGRVARRRRAMASFAALLVGVGLVLVCPVAGGVWLGLVVVVWWLRPFPDPGRWARGAAGEEATAALLERLPRTWAVLHDRRIPGSRANVDHLVVGRRSVWVVDSKAYRGRVRAGWRVGWRGVRVGGRRLDTGPVAWEASVVEERLGVEVDPLVVVHGAGLRRRRRTGGVTVVPADRLVSELRRGDRRRWQFLGRRHGGGGRGDRQSRERDDALGVQGP